jgi:Putative transposase
MMTLDTSEFIRRFLIHVLPKGFHRIRHYGLFAGGTKTARIATARRLLGAPAANISADIDSADDAANDQCNENAETLTSPCPCCGGRMRIIETFNRGASPRHRASPSRLVIRIDTS